MGVQILWLMPVHPIGIPHRKGTLGSYYSISDHKGINPEFGTMADFEELVSEIHNLGMKVILDWVANHAAWDHVWTIQNPKFFVQDEFGFKSPFDWTDVIQIDHQNPEQQEAMIDAMHFWVEEKNVDGFRADLAHLTPLAFWQKARLAIDAIRPGIIWLAETEDVEYVKAFDITFTWRWMHISQQALKEKGGISPLTEFLGSDDFPGLRLYFTTNHDENSWNGTEYEKYGVYAQALAVFSCLYLNSVPLIYSGQEAANKRRLAFFEKDAINWGEFELKQFYSGLLNIRMKPGISFEREGFKIYNHPEVLIISHTGEAGTIWVFLHFGTRETLIQPFELAGVEGIELFSGETYNASAPAISMKPGDHLVYESFRREG